MDKTEHLAAVEDVAAGITPALKEISSSWLRSAAQFGVDPANKRAPAILSATELKERREPLDRLIGVAREEIDSLYRIVSKSGYVVLVCDAGGVAVDHRGEERQADDFKYWGTWLGGVWSEAIEGTNGVGTCIEDRTPVTVHLSQHFRSRNIGLSCSGAPVFNDDGSLLAVVDVSAINPSLSAQAHGLTGPLTVSTARCIEERLFRDSFRSHWVVASSQDSGEAILLAVDSDFRIVGADFAARKYLKLDSAMLGNGVSMWRYFARDVSAFRPRDGMDIAARLSATASDKVVPAIVTPPHSLCAAGLATSMHTRPRQNLLLSIDLNASPPPARGGLGGAAMKRVRDYIEAHLNEKVALSTLAEVTGLSAFHFSRQFKQAFGVTPHRYLMKQRVERARQLLESTDKTVSEIAAATGFADQGHLTRQFRQICGTTPRQYRQTQR